MVDSVILSVPYFSSELETEEGEEVRYELDSVYGDDPIKLTVAASDYFINNYDPDTDFQERQRYYSDLQPKIENHLGSILFQSDSFVPSSAEVVEYPVDDKGETDTLRLKPRMRLHLSKYFFQQFIIEKEGSPELQSQNNFRDYLRGIFLKAEPAGEEGSMVYLDLLNTEAGITIYYSYERKDVEDSDSDGDKEEFILANNSYDIKFGPTRINTFVQDTPEFSDPENLFLKGGEGSMAVIELFSGPDSDGDGSSDELEFLRENNWLINEANLEFYVNRDYMAGMNEPERLYIYNLENNVMLVDYVLEEPGRVNPPESKANLGHLVPLERDADKEGVKYKIRLTQHINRVLNKDSANVKLGVVVTHNVNIISSADIRNTTESDVDKVPTGSVITPEATVLHGPEAEDEGKRLKLNIYYTEPKQ